MSKKQRLFVGSIFILAVTFLVAADAYDRFDWYNNYQAESDAFVDQHEKKNHLGKYTKKHQDALR